MRLYFIFYYFVLAVLIVSSLSGSTVQVSLLLFKLNLMSAAVLRKDVRAQCA